MSVPTSSRHPATSRLRLTSLRRVPMLVAVSALCVGLLLTGGPLRPARAEKTMSLAQSNNEFGYRLYDQLRTGDGNLFFSPYSVHSAVLMAREGAAGDTATEMDRVLFTSGLRVEGRGSAWRRLRENLAAPKFRDGQGREAKLRPAYEINVANALWGQTGFPFEAAFTKRLGDSYGAPLERIDFQDTAAARARINDWVAKETREKIKNIVPEGLPSPGTRLALANAIYFKAPWQDPFRERMTKPDTFTGPKGTQQTVPFMRRVGRYKYGRLNDVEMLEIPYKEGAAVMRIFLPGAKDGALGALEAAFARGSFVSLDKWMPLRQVDVKLPKFQFTAFKDLTGVLPAMGMPLAFDPSKADFSKMTGAEKLYVGAVLHKAFVAVDEEGTEAAAATVMMWKGTAAPRAQEPVVFDADRPFLFTIVNRATGTILFTGRVTNPAP